MEQWMHPWQTHCRQTNISIIIEAGKIVCNTSYIICMNTCNMKLVLHIKHRYLSLFFNLGWPVYSHQRDFLCISVHSLNEFHTLRGCKQLLVPENQHLFSYPFHPFQLSHYDLLTPYGDKDLSATSHYMNQYWLVISGVLCHSPNQSHFTCLRYHFVK